MFNDSENKQPLCMYTFTAYSFFVYIVTFYSPNIHIYINLIYEKNYYWG